MLALFDPEVDAIQGIRRRSDGIPRYRDLTLPTSTTGIMSTLLVLPTELVLRVLAEVEPLDLIRMSQVGTSPHLQLSKVSNNDARCASELLIYRLIVQYGQTP